MVPLEQLEYGVYGDLTILYPEPCSVYLRGPIIRPAENMIPDLLHSGKPRKSQVQPT